jgi:hypothetical protein
MSLAEYYEQREKDIKELRDFITAKLKEPLTIRII